MDSAFHFVTEPDECSYLPDRVRSMEHDIFRSLSAAEYLKLMQQGWRRFGRMVFRPQCPHCHACQSLRVAVQRFRPNRSQRRVRQMNEGVVRLQIGRPAVTEAKVELHRRYHAFQADFKGWPLHEPETEEAYRHSFVENPFPTREYCYYFGDELIAVGYVDDLPGALSAIYCFYAPEHRSRSPGTWNVLCILEQAARRAIPYAYLGYYVAGCRSMEYKAKFVPNEVLGGDGQWRPFRP
jgi:arginine-tRNA-protein transferase